MAMSELSCGADFAGSGEPLSIEKDCARKGDVVAMGCKKVAGGEETLLKDIIGVADFFADAEGMTGNREVVARKIDFFM